MKLHLEHVISGFRKAGCQTMTADYHDMAAWYGLPLPEKWAQEQRERALEKILKKHRPDVCFFAGSIPFDLGRIKSYYPGLVVFHDYDGPRRRSLDSFAELSKSCLLLTVSRYIERELRLRDRTAFYLPHGVDTDYYAPDNGSANSYPADISFIGRATERRIDICGKSGMDIALYGDRWKKTALAGMCRLPRNVYGNEVVSIYRDTTVMINILQEPLENFNTILSLQCFAIPSTGTCLCAEFAEEFPEHFEEGKEVLLFRDPAELPELLKRAAADK